MASGELHPWKGISEEREVIEGMVLSPGDPGYYPNQIVIPTGGSHDILLTRVTGRRQAETQTSEVSCSERLAPELDNRPIPSIEVDWEKSPHYTGESEAGQF